MIELVIKIPEDEYQSILLTGKANFRTINAIEAGTPLPKRHGRLIDADAYIDKHAVCGYLEDIEVHDFNTITPTIIEADTMGSEEQNENAETQ